MTLLLVLALNTNIYLGDMNIDNAIEKASRSHGVEAPLIRAVIKQESNFNPLAFRHEPHKKDSSWGLMQVLLNTAREVTKNQGLTAQELIKPEVNVDIGTRYLATQLKKYHGNIKDALAAYNAGKARKDLRGNYLNQSYVDKVYRNYQLYKAKEYAGALYLLPLFAVGMITYNITRR